MQLLNCIPTPWIALTQIVSVWEKTRSSNYDNQLNQFQHNCGRWKVPILWTRQGCSFQMMLGIWYLWTKEYPKVKTNPLSLITILIVYLIKKQILHFASRFLNCSVAHEEEIRRLHCLNVNTQPKEPESFLEIYSANCHHRHLLIIFYVLIPFAVILYQ